MEIRHVLVRVLRSLPVRGATGPAGPGGPSAEPLREGQNAILVPRADWERLTARLETLGALTELVGTLEKDGAAQQARTQAELGRLRSALRETDRRLGEMGEVLDLMRAEGVERHTELTREDFMIHYELRDRLGTLCTQRIPDLIGPRTEAESPVDLVLRRAQLTRLVSLALFGPEYGVWKGPDLDELARVVTDDDRVWLSPDHQKLLKRVGTEATRLYGVVTGSAYAGHFDFAVERGTPACPPDHELWTGCEAGHPVDFVATPGYVVAGRRLLAPTVHTSAGPTEHHKRG